MRQLTTTKGFSLLELMVVITIMGLLLALSVPALARFLQNWRLNAEVDQVAMMMRAARSTAIMRNTNTVFQFDLQANTYGYFEDRDGDGDHDDNEYQDEAALPEGLVFDRHTLTDTQLGFGPRGNCEESGSITLSNTNYRERTIVVFGGTGNIRVD